MREGERRALRGVPGYSTLEFAGVLLLVLTLIVGLLQAVIYIHARDVVRASVQEGARVASSEGRSVAAGKAQSRALLEAGLGRASKHLEVRGVDLGDQVQFRVRGRYPLMIPGVRKTVPIEAETSMAKERFAPHGEDPKP
jgi:hypothetical protein